MPIRTYTPSSPSTDLYFTIDLYYLLPTLIHKKLGHLDVGVEVVRGRAEPQRFFTHDAPDAMETVPLPLAVVLS